MKTHLKLAALALLLLTINIQLSTTIAQGALTPPGAPAPTMKTLAQIEPRTPISAIPYTIASSGSYYLTTNVTGTSGNGITIASGNVTLDLEGFAVRGGADSAAGIYVGGTYTNITIRNGSVSGWGDYGVDAFFNGNPRNVVVERLTVSANAGYGIITQDTSVVRDCVAEGNGVGNGYVGIYIVGGLISGCSSHDNNGNGIDAVNSLVRDCQVEFNSYYGIYAVSSTVSGCLVQNSVNSGIYVDGPGCQIIGNNCKGNNTSGSTNDAGIFIDDSNNRVEDNQVTVSGHTGIEVASGYVKNVIIKNSVSGNTNTLANNYIISGNNAVGPLISAFGTITNSNPWANFSY